MGCPDGDVCRRLQARVRELERQAAAAAEATATVRGKATRDEEVRRLLDGYPHVNASFVDKTGKPHAGLKRHAERLTDLGLSIVKARKVLPELTDEDVAVLPPEHDGLRQAIAATKVALDEGERTLARQSRDLVWAAAHGWAFVDDMAAPDTQLTMGKEEEKRYKELVEQKRKAEAEAQAAKTTRTPAAGRGGDRGHRWGGGRGRGHYDWRERGRHDYWGGSLDDRWHGSGSHGYYHGGGRGGPVPPSFGAGRGGRGGRGGN